MIRVDYDSTYKILYLDSDELLAPSSILLDTFWPNNPKYNFTMASLKEDIYKNWGNGYTNEEYQLYRMAVSAFTPTRVVHMINVSIDGDMIIPTTKCTLNGMYL